MKNKIVKILIIIAIAFVVLIFGFMIYTNLTSSNSGDRLSGVNSHKLSNDEINQAKDILNELGSIDSIDISISNKIIKIFVKLNADLDLKTVQEKSDAMLTGISEDNLSFYDVELFFTNESNKDSEIYPQIGYKHKTDKGFTW